MNKTIIIGLVLAVAIVGGYFIFGKNNPASAPAQDSAQLPAANSPAVPEEMPSGNEVVYTAGGYSPATLTIKVGETVVWKNEGAEGMWTASAMHPSHTVYSGTALEEHCPDTAGTAFDACTSVPPGSTWSFTFTKPGTWRYHNHVDASYFGTIVVE